MKREVTFDINVHLHVIHTRVIKYMYDVSILMCLVPFWSNLPEENLLSQSKVRAGPTKPGKVGEILALYQLKSLDSKTKLKLNCFFLQVAPFLQIICVLW